MAEFDPEKFGREMGSIVKDAVTRALAPVEARATQLEQRLAAAEARLAELEAAKK